MTTNRMTPTPRLPTGPPAEFAGTTLDRHAARMRAKYGPASERRKNRWRDVPIEERRRAMAEVRKGKRK